MKDGGKIEVKASQRQCGCRCASHVGQDEDDLLTIYSIAAFATRYLTSVVCGTSDRAQDDCERIISKDDQYAR